MTKKFDDENFGAVSKFDDSFEIKMCEGFLRSFPDGFDGDNMGD
jgi:hypothetical protein